ncbi:MAG: hypothetical protein ACK2UK_09000 [Candidatus Promineifilaceae bacterium]
MIHNRFVHIFFMDGVGLGPSDPTINPFARARTPNLDALLGRDDWFRAGNGQINAQRATLAPTDATLGVPGRPQSATGQATILTGRNVPQLVGEHFGPKPNAAVAEVIRQGTLFKDVAEAGGRAALITPYPQGYFDAIASGKRLYSAVPLAVVQAGWPLFTIDELRQGRAVSPDFSNAGWREFLKQDDLELLAPYEAGRRIAAVAQAYDFSFFEHWPSDRSGHRGSLVHAAEHIEKIDAALGGLLAAWPEERGLLIITSDHGNIEEKDHRLHTRNPVPTIVVGPDHSGLAARIWDLSDIAAVVRSFLGLKKRV